MCAAQQKLLSSLFRSCQIVPHEQEQINYRNGTDSKVCQGCHQEPYGRILTLRPRQLYLCKFNTPSAINTTYLVLPHDTSYLQDLSCQQTHNHRFDTSLALLKCSVHDIDGTGLQSRLNRVQQNLANKHCSDSVL